MVITSSKRSMRLRVPIPYTAIRDIVLPPLEEETGEVRNSSTTFTNIHRRRRRPLQSPGRNSAAAILIRERAEQEMLDFVARANDARFKEVLEVFKNCNVDSHFDFMREYLLRFSLKIYGLPQCDTRDLHLAIYLFLEEVFGVTVKLELCVKLVESENDNVVGVVLEKFRDGILSQSRCLEGTGIEMKANEDLGWMLDGLVLHRRDICN